MLRRLCFMVSPVMSSPMMEVCSRQTVTPSGGGLLFFSVRWPSGNGCVRKGRAFFGWFGDA